MLLRSDRLSSARSVREAPASALVCSHLNAGTDRPSVMERLAEAYAAAL